VSTVVYLFWELVDVVTVLRFADIADDSWGWSPTQKRIPHKATRALVKLIWYPALVIGFMPELLLAVIVFPFVWLVSLIIRPEHNR
jgi:hypothetical protein